VTTRELPRDVAEWLAARAAPPPVGWAPDPPVESLACHPDLVERLASSARPLRGVRRTFVAGCPVVHHPNGDAIACAWGTNALVVRAGGVAGPLDAGVRTEGLGADWLDVDPWPTDVLFRRATDLLRDIVRRAYDAASMRNTG
jgi:hypothetical protein